MDEPLTKKEKRILRKQEKKERREKEKSTRKFKKFGVWGISFVLAFFLGSKFINWIKTPVSISVEGLEVSEGDWVKGNPEASLTLVEYGDFQCPACSLYAPIVKRLSEELPEKLRVVYRHFPITAIHQNAFDAARASEAAGKQEAFWEMHDALYAKQDEWAEARNAKEKFLEYAKELQLDEEMFLQDFESDETKEKIEAQTFSGTRAGVNSTPSFFLNGSKVVNPGDFDSFKSLLEQNL